MKKNLITTALLATLATTVHAESATNQLQPITVYSAYATPINQDKTASSVTVLTEKDFADRNATYVSDVLKTVPGVAIGANGGRGTVTSLFLRGANSNHTSVIIDGVKVNPADTNFSFGGLTLSNIERIEVLRGEQSALWGSDAMGGVIYITTKSGLYKDKAFNIDFDFGTGSHRTLDGSVTISGHNNGFYYALHGNSHKTAGISVASKERFTYTSEKGDTIHTGGSIEKDKFHRDNSSLRLGYDDNNKGIEFFASHASQTYYNDSLTPSQDPQNNKVYFYSENLAPSSLRTRETLFKLGGYIGNEQELLKHKANISHLKLDGDTFGLNASSKDWKKLNINYQLDINFDNEGDISQAISLLADYQRSEYTSNHYKGVEKRLSEKSLAAEYRLFSIDDHSISLSGRFTDNSQYKNAWTGRIAGGYRLSPNFRLHASFGSAIRNPSFIETYGWNGSFIGNPNLKPEKSRGGDIGVLVESSDKKHSLDIAYFARNIRDFIDINSTWNGSINRTDKTKIRGVELAYNGKLTADLTAYANYTYTDIKADKQKDQYGTNYLRRPKHSANAGLAYQVTDKLKTDLNIAYVGKRYDMYYGLYPYQSTVELPSYTLVNFGTNYQLTKNLNIYAHLNNVFDKKYENVLGYGQFGRNVYLGLKGSF